MHEQVPSTFIALINRCINDATSDDWSQFVNKFDKYIRGYIRKYFLKQALPFDKNLVDDLVQDVYLQLLMDNKKALRAFAGSTDCSFLSYLSAISQTITGMYYRPCNANKRKAQIVPLDSVLITIGDFSDKENDSQTEILQFELSDLISHTLSGNNKDRDQQIFNLYLEGFTSKEIAQTNKFQIEQSTIEVTIRRTKNKLHTNFYAMAA